MHLRDSFARAHGLDSVQTSLRLRSRHLGPAEGQVETGAEGEDHDLAHRTFDVSRGVDAEEGNGAGYDFFVAAVAEPEDDLAAVVAAERTVGAAAGDTVEEAAEESWAGTELAEV